MERRNQFLVGLGSVALALVAVRCSTADSANLSSNVSDAGPMRPTRFEDAKPRGDSNGDGDEADAGMRDADAAEVDPNRSTYCCAFNGERYDCPNETAFTQCSKDRDAASCTPRGTSCTDGGDVVAVPVTGTSADTGANVSVGPNRLDGGIKGALCASDNDCALTFSCVDTGDTSGSKTCGKNCFGGGDCVLGDHCCSGLGVGLTAVCVPILVNNGQCKL